VQILGVERFITEHLGLTVWTQRPSEKVKILKLWVLVLRPIWKRCSPRNLISNVRININICIKISFCFSRALQPLQYPAVASELWGQGVHCSPQVQDLYPMYPPSQRCGICKNFKQTILTTRLYNVRTNLYPPLTKTFRRACYPASNTDLQPRVLLYGPTTQSVHSQWRSSQPTAINTRLYSQLSVQLRS